MQRSGNKLEKEMMKAAGVERETRSEPDSEDGDDEERGSVVHHQLGYEMAEMVPLSLADRQHRLDLGLDSTTKVNKWLKTEVGKDNSAVNGMASQHRTAVQDPVNAKELAKALMEMVPLPEEKAMELLRSHNWSIHVAMNSLLDG
jgi:hypothetical protein